LLAGPTEKFKGATARDRMKKSIDAMGSIGGIIDRGFECGLDEDERFLRGDAHARKFDAVNDDAVNDAKEIESENARTRRDACWF